MWIYSWAAVLVLLLTGCSAHTATSGRIAIRDDRAIVETRFSDRDRTIVQEYYRITKPKKASTGLAKRDVLPPGLQGKPLPRDLVGRLSPLPATQSRIIVGQDIVLMQRDTRVVLDILYGVAD